jgi:hypothetical protein
MLRHEERLHDAGRVRYDSALTPPRVQRTALPRRPTASCTSDCRRRGGRGLGGHRRSSPRRLDAYEATARSAAEIAVANRVAPIVGLPLVDAPDVRARASSSPRAASWSEPSAAPESLRRTLRSVGAA